MLDAGRRPRSSVLVVDDEPKIRELLHLYLARDGHQVIEADDGPAAIEAMRAHRCQLVLLDVMLPGLDGFEVCRQIRSESDAPIVLLTARSGDSDKVVGLDLGADDYVVKPFSPRELMARVRAHLRRHRPEPRSQSVLVADGLALDPNQVTVALNGTPIAVTATEFRLLWTLMRQPARVISRDELIDAIYGHGDAGIIDRTIDVHLGRLRRKLGDRANDPRFIATVRSVGYRFVRPVEQRNEVDA
jgi:DNA-binding response OmpR family regulator